MDTPSLHEVRQALANATSQLHYAQQLLDNIDSSELDRVSMTGVTTEPSFVGNNQVIEGVFNGQNMVGADGKVYTVPSNYASKSKLVEGDILKLTIKSDGTFIYKQIGPVERKRMVGALVRDDSTGELSVLVGKRSYRVILAAVTYYKGQPGDEVVILTPEDGESQWAAVENLIHRDSDEELLPLGDAAELPSGG
ncbi:MAG: hypothetical protein WCV88_01335 [Patescibacteria group bacterium]|jgi:hypothetical protein